MAERDIKRVAFGMLARRPLTCRELARKLRLKGFELTEIEPLVVHLRAERLLNDRALAEDALELRAERLGFGPVRLIEELVERGVDRGMAESVWGELVEQERVDPRALLERRLDRQLRKQRGELDARAVGRVYSALIRAGYEAQEIRRALESRFGAEWMNAPH